MIASRGAAVLCSLVLTACGSDPPDRARRVEEPEGGSGSMREPEGGGGAMSGAAGSGDRGVAGTLGQPSARIEPRPAPNVNAILQGGCASAPVESQLLPSNLLIVLDRSASMACNPPPITDSPTCEAEPVRATDDENKWEITREALEGAIDRLPSETVVGLSYFSNDDSCGVHSLPSVPLSPLDPRQVSALHASLANVTPEGATPLVGATVLAYRHLHSQALAGKIHGSKYVVLITDGEQSNACTDTTRCKNAEECTKLLVEDEVPRAASIGVGIKTFVIGAPGSEPARTVLSAIAVAGGTAPEGCDIEQGDCHFDMTRQDEFDTALQSALREISGQALSCELPLPDPGKGTIELERLNVIYSPANGREPELIRQDSRPCERGADGWQYAAGAAKILLCGPTCDRVRADRGARLDVVLGCPAVRVN